MTCVCVCVVPGILQLKVPHKRSQSRISSFFAAGLQGIFFAIGFSWKSTTNDRFWLKQNSHGFKDGFFKVLPRKLTNRLEDENSV